MAAREIVRIGHPALKNKNRSVALFFSPSTKKLIQDLQDTMYKEGLIGVAAPQIGKNVKMFVTHPRNTNTRNLKNGDKLRVFINPVITAFSKEHSVIYEGCGCIPDVFGPVERPVEITVHAYDEEGKKFSLVCDGILARVIQHEYDHLQGIEFIEKLSDYSKIMNRKYYMQNIKKSRLQTLASKITKVQFKYL
jgi:peptide deformylase